MGFDKIVVDAVNKAVEDEGQNKAVSKRLVSWLNELADGRTRLENVDDTPRRLEEVLNAISVGNVSEA
jgi:hypothetical protein